MAAGLGFKDFVTGEVLTSTDVDGYLMQGIWVFASAAARSSAVTSPQEGNFSYLKDTNSTEYYTGSAWVSASGGGGKVLQVVSGTYSTQTVIASTSYSDTGLTLSITPTLATSKVLVLVTQNAGASRAVADIGYTTQLVRTATSLQEIIDTDVSSVNTQSAVSFSYLDNPATTSATTYKTQGKCTTTANSASAFYQIGGVMSTIVLLEIGA